MHKKLPTAYNYSSGTAGISSLSLAFGQILAWTGFWQNYEDISPYFLFRLTFFAPQEQGTNMSMAALSGSMWEAFILAAWFGLV